MTFDNRRGVTILHGGSSLSSQTFTDTWEWDGNVWTRVETNGPAATSGAMCFDSIHGAVVLFTGTETWEFSEHQWTRRSVTGPPPRQGAAMAYDDSRGVSVLFGGYRQGAPVFGDTWEWDGANWTQRANSGPAPRHRHLMAYDHARSVVVVLGGALNAGEFEFATDAWEWDGHAWTLRESNSPGAYSRAAIAYDIDRDLLVVTSAFSTAIWNGDEWSLSSEPSRPRRAFFATAYDVPRAKIVKYGGFSYGDTGTPDDTWEWDGEEWEQIATPDPVAYAGQMIFDPIRQRCLLLGLQDRSSDDTLRVYVWEWSDEEWVPLTNDGPEASHGFSAAYDHRRNTVLVVSWSGYEKNFAETWEWNGLDWQLRSNRGPLWREYAAISYDRARSTTVLFGGMHNGSLLNDTWEWDGESWRQVDEGTGPTRRFGAVFAYDSIRQRTLLFGGSLDSGYHFFSNEVWEWNGSAWQLHLVDGPPATMGSGFVFDEARDEFVMYGGRIAHGSVHNSQTWALRRIPSLVADMNCDGARNNFDIEPFVLALNSPTEFAEVFPDCDPAHGDVNQDGALNNFDVDLFVDCILNSGCP
ncbi:MAG: hypothetical protein JNG88_06915 [Phycisphaerales bacterium]|nr:hypothetical protein [Phycisphaerales bacterium]